MVHCVAPKPISYPLDSIFHKLLVFSVPYGSVFNQTFLHFTRNFSFVEIILSNLLIVFLLEMPVDGDFFFFRDPLKGV